MNLSSGNISVRPRFVYDMNMTDVYHMVWKEMKKLSWCKIYTFWIYTVKDH